MTRYIFSAETTQEYLDHEEYYDDLKHGPHWQRDRPAEPVIEKKPAVPPFHATVPVGERKGFELALWHYRHLKYWRPTHDTACPCGQKDDGEPEVFVPLWEQP